MKKLTIETDRSVRLNPKQELNYLAWFFGITILLILTCEFLSADRDEYISIQGKIVYFFFLVFIMRLFTISTWGQHYKETINYIFCSTKFDNYVKSSLLNVLFDLCILYCLFFWIELDKVAFINVPMAGLVYLLLIGFSILKRKRQLTSK